MDLNQREGSIPVLVFAKLPRPGHCKTRLAERVGPTTAAHLAESFGMSMEVHGGGAANLTALGAMGIPGRFYERGLLHPFIDYDEVEPWLNAKTDFLDPEGFVHLPQVPGIGDDINFDYIRENGV